MVVTEIGASKESTKAPDADAMAVQLARRDLNVVPSLLPCKPLIKSLLASDLTSFVIRLMVSHDTSGGSRTLLLGGGGAKVA